MSNLRVIYDNAANRSSSLVASTTAGSLAASNLLTDIKSQVWRSTATSATLTAEWADAEMMACVALPFCNLTSAATIRVRGYTEIADPSPLFDTGAVMACAYAALGLWDWGLQPLGVNAFSYGGGNYGRIWFAPNWVKKLVVDLVDSGNTLGYIECARLIAGNYWSPATNAAQGASILPQDTSTHYRNDAGDLLTNIGTRSRKISLNLSHMLAADRAHFMNILLGNGMPKPVFLSLHPDDGDPVREQTYQVYGKLSSISAVSSVRFDYCSAPLELEEV